MTKTKSQLRAEAVERLKDTRMDSGSAVKKLAAAIGSEWDPPSVNYSLGCLKSKLIDLLTDDEPQDGTTPEFDVPLYRWHEGDTREKLEAEILDAGCADEIDYDRIVGWLDRQAAITWRESEEHHPNPYYPTMYEQIEYYRKENAELQAKVDALESENVKLKAKYRDFMHKCAAGECDRIAELEAVIDGLDEIIKRAGVDSVDGEWKDGCYIDKLAKAEDEVVELQKKCRGLEEFRIQACLERDELEAVNEQLREKLSRAYDNAHDTLRMM